MQESQVTDEIRRPFEAARGLVRAFTGLYPDEDLVSDVLRLCDEVWPSVSSHSRCAELRSEVAVRCRDLMEVTNRHAPRDPVQIAAARAQVIAALDGLQDAVFIERKRTTYRTPPSLLRRPSG